MRWRSGKIGRMPAELREKLNERLREGLSGKAATAWLNGLAEARDYLRKEHSGRPVNEQNISDWRQTGYLEWLSQRQAQEAAERLAKEDLPGEQDKPWTDRLCHWLSLRYAVAAQKLEREDGTMDLKELDRVCKRAVELRRGDHWESVLRMKMETLNVAKEAQREAREEEFWEWCRKPEIHGRLVEQFKHYRDPVQQLNDMRRKIYGFLAEELPKNEKGEVMVFWGMPPWMDGSSRPLAPEYDVDEEHRKIMERVMERAARIMAQIQTAPGQPVNLEKLEAELDREESSLIKDRGEEIKDNPDEIKDESSEIEDNQG